MQVPSASALIAECKEPVLGASNPLLYRACYCLLRRCLFMVARAVSNCRIWFV